MTVIDGIGEEVVDFFIVLLLTIIITSAWMSTNSRPRSYRTVFVMGHSASPHNAVLSSNTPQTVSTSSTPSTQEEGLVEDIMPLSEVDVTMADDNRLHLYSVDEPSESESTEDGEPENEPDNAQVREMDSIVNAMEADRCRDCEYFNRPRDTTNNNDSASRQTSNLPNQNNVISNNEEGDNKINIKLKYLNDSSKDVVGSLNELLKDFKLRHFSNELTSQLTVKIIFKGRLLADESTLGECGVHDHAVLHCLIHPLRQRSQTQIASEEASRAQIQQEVPREIIVERTWDLENVLMTLVSVALTVVWFLRCEYSSMFTASASVALFGLTVFYGVAIFGLYLSDTIQFNQRPRQRTIEN